MIKYLQKIGYNFWKKVAESKKVKIKETTGIIDMMKVGLESILDFWNGLVAQRLRCRIT